MIGPCTIGFTSVLILFELSVKITRRELWSVKGFRQKASVILAHVTKCVFEKKNISRSKRM